MKHTGLCHNITRALNQFLDFKGARLPLTEKNPAHATLTFTYLLRSFQSASFFFFSLFPDDLESKADDGTNEDKAPKDQPAEEVSLQSTILLCRQKSTHLVERRFTT